jgi:hypothetical protein
LGSRAVYLNKVLERLSGEREREREGERGEEREGERETPISLLLPPHWRLTQRAALAWCTLVSHSLSLSLSLSAQDGSLSLSWNPALVQLSQSREDSLVVFGEQMLRFGER